MSDKEILETLIKELKKDIEIFSNKKIEDFMLRKGLEQDYLKGAVETCESVLKRIADLRGEDNE